MDELIIVQDNVELNTDRIRSLNNEVITCCQNFVVEKTLQIDLATVEPYTTVPNIINCKSILHVDEPPSQTVYTKIDYLYFDMIYDF